MKWKFGLPVKKRASNRGEAGPSTVEPARHSSAGPSSGRPPRPSSVAADAIAGVPIAPNVNPTSSVASAHTSSRASGATNQSSSGEASSRLAEPAEPHVVPMESEPAEAEPIVAPAAAPDHSGSFHWDYSIPELTPSRGTHAAEVANDVIQQFFGGDFLSPYDNLGIDVQAGQRGAARAIQGEAGAGPSNPVAPQENMPAHFYNEGFYPGGQTAYPFEPAVFDVNGVCITCACFGGHYVWCVYRHVPLPLPVDYRCPRCHLGGHLEIACPIPLPSAQSVTHPVQPSPQSVQPSPQSVQPVPQPVQPVPQPVPPVKQPDPPAEQTTPTRPTHQSSQDSGLQLRGSHCPMCGAHKKHWYRNLVCK